MRPAAAPSRGRRGRAAPTWSARGDRRRHPRRQRVAHGAGPSSAGTMPRTFGAGVVRDQRIGSARRRGGHRRRVQHLAPAANAGRRPASRRCAATRTMGACASRPEVTTPVGRCCRWPCTPTTDGPTSVRDIAERTGLPQPYLEQILLALKGAGLVRSKRGVGGGYVLARRPRRSGCPRSCRPSTARSRSATSASRTRTAPATTRASACCIAVWNEAGEYMRHHLDSYTLADDRRHGAQGDAPWPCARRRRSPSSVGAGLTQPRRQRRARARASRGTSRRSAGSGLVNVSRAPVAGWSNDSSAACRNGRVSAERRAPVAVGRVADERVADRRRGGRGSGGCARSPAGTSGGASSAGADVAARRTWYSVRAGLPSTTTAIRSGSRGVAPDRRVDDAVRRVGVAPHDGVVAPAGAVGGELADQRRRTRRRVRATTSRPEVPASRRWTMPGRSGSPTPASSGNRASSPLTSVPSGLPAPGWTTSPAGLSTTITSSSTWTTRELDVGSPVGQSAAGTSPGRPRRRCPSSRRTLPDRGRRRRRRAPRRRRSTAAAAERLTSASSATTRSSRSPASAAGTVLDRSSLVRVDRPSAASPSTVGAAAGVGAQVLSSSSAPPTVTPMSATLKIGHHCRSMKSTTPPRSQPVAAEQAVEQVADGAADDQPDGERVRARLVERAERDQQADDHDAGRRRR